MQVKSEFLIPQFPCASEGFLFGFARSDSDGEINLISCSQGQKNFTEISKYSNGDELAWKRSRSESEMLPKMRLTPSYAVELHLASHGTWFGDNHRCRPCRAPSGVVERPGRQMTTTAHKHRLESVMLKKLPKSSCILVAGAEHKGWMVGNRELQFTACKAKQQHLSDHSG